MRSRVVAVIRKQVCYFSSSFLAPSLFFLLLCALLFPPMAAFTRLLAFGFSLSIIPLLPFLTLSALLVVKFANKNLQANAASPRPESSSDNSTEEAKASGDRDCQFSRAEEPNVVDNSPGLENINNKNVYELLDSRENSNVSRILTPSDGSTRPDPEEEEEEEEEEENLIEISVPSQQLVEWKVQADRVSEEQQQTVEVFEEMEDNLIELDISVGFVKCPGIGAPSGI